MSYIELTRCTKAELWDLLREMFASLPGLPERSEARANAMLNIQHIRIFLARPDYTPC